ncbi:hypothetical protein [Kordiimonas laminariae]|uniref:hypothetical protein n=1 Tax=Kordiimonas laminariae TaxID=2917717 RepID=UPI001FF1CB3D|nr:hypothetical protein [Kordiimonas laminariae]MCK0070727.1 hypothetical protein [Kordiimonas laminariae]
MSKAIVKLKYSLQKAGNCKHAGRVDQLVNAFSRSAVISYVSDDRNLVEVSDTAENIQKLKKDLDGTCRVMLNGKAIAL